MRADFRENYERIAREHLDHWRQTGQNPWQSFIHVEAVGAATAQLVIDYSDMGAKILDAGCGMGDLLERVGGRRRYGCDLSADYLEIAKSRGLTVAQCDLEAMPYSDDEFDLVVAADVLEHVLDVNAVLSEMIRVLRPGGHLVIRTPENEDLTGYLSPDYPYRFAHLRRFDEPSFRLLLERIFDLIVVEVVRTFGTAWELNVVARK